MICTQNSYMIRKRNPGLSRKLNSEVMIFSDISTLSRPMSKVKKGGKSLYTATAGHRLPPFTVHIGELHKLKKYIFYSLFLKYAGLCDLAPTLFNI